MVFFASLIVALGATLWLVSYIAKMLHAKRSGMGWVFLAWITGGIFAVLAAIPLSMFASELDPTVFLITSIVLSLIITSAAYKFINQMGWGGAITTNIASNVIGLVAVVVAVLATGNSLKDTYSSFNEIAQQNSSMAGGLIGNDVNLNTNDVINDGTLFAENGMSDVNDNNPLNAHDAINEGGEELVEMDEDMEPVFKEADLLPKSVLRQEQAKKKRYVSPKYHVVSIGRINSLVGRSIRISKSNGKVVAGSLQNIRGNNAVLKQRIHGGVATIPVSIATIRKLEVYR